MALPLHGIAIARLRTHIVSNPLEQTTLPQLGMTVRPRETWVRVPASSDFTIYNLPYGVFSTASTPARCGVAIGDAILDLAAIAPLLRGVQARPARRALARTRLPPAGTQHARTSQRS